MAPKFSILKNPQW